MRQTLSPELEVAVELARSRAGESGELQAVILDGPRSALPEEAIAFVRQILTDGTYAEEVRRIGTEDPEVASI
jgi:hypothetical protein